MTRVRGDRSRDSDVLVASCGHLLLRGLVAFGCHELREEHGRTVGARPGLVASAGFPSAYGTGSTGDPAARRKSLRGDGSHHEPKHRIEAIGLGLTRSKAHYTSRGRAP